MAEVNKQNYSSETTIANLKAASIHPEASSRLTITKVETNMRWPAEAYVTGFLKVCLPSTDVFIFFNLWTERATIDTNQLKYQIKLSCSGNSREANSISSNSSEPLPFFSHFRKIYLSTSFDFCSNGDYANLKFSKNIGKALLIKRLLR